MSSRNDYKIRITADSSGVKSGVNAAKGELNSIAATASELSGKLGGIFAGVSIGAFAGKLIAVQREFDVLNSSLITVTGSSSAAAREFAWIKQFAAETPYGLNQVTQAFVKMKSLGLDATEAALRSYGNTASAMGKDLNQMIEAVADASTGEFERLKEFGIKAKQQGDQVSLTFQGVTKTIGNNAAEITKYLQDIGNNEFGAAMAERAKTLDGAISNLGDSWDELFRTINQNNAGGLIYDSVKLANGAITDAIDILNGLNRATGENATQTGAAAAIQEGLAITFETVAVLGANLSYVLVGIGREIGGLAAQAAAAAKLDFSGAAEIGRLMKSDAEAARAAIDAQTASILSARANADEYRQVLENAKKGTADYNTTVGRLIEMQNAGKISAQEFRTAVESLQPAIKGASKPAGQLGTTLGGTRKAAKEAKDEIADLIAKLEAKEIEEAAKAVQAYNDAWSDYLNGLDQNARALDQQIDQYGMTEAQIAQVTLRRAEERLEMAKMSDGVAPDYLAALEQEVALRRQIAGSAGKLEAMEANKSAAEQAAQDWQRTADAIEDALIDALMEGGKSGKEYIEGLFRTMVLRPTVQAIVQPVAGSITSALGVGQPGQGTLGSSGSIGLPPGIGSTSMISTGLQWAGSALGSATLSSFGAGMSMTTAQIANLSSAGLINGTAASLGSTVATAMPYVGAALFAAQALGLFDKKPSDKSSWASFDPTTGRTYDVGSMSGKKDPGQEQRDATAALAMLTGGFAGLAGIDASVTAMIGGRDGTRLRINRDEGTQGFLTPQAGLANGGNSLNYGNGEEAIKKMLDDLVDEGTLPQATIDAWRAAKTDMLGTARDAGELVSVLNLLTADYDTATIERANLLQTEGEMLEQAVGRMEQIEAVLGGNMLPGDAMASAAADMVKTLSGLALGAIPQTNEALGQIINGLDTTSEEGQKTYKSLMALAPGFIELQAAQDQLYNGLLTDEQRLSKATGEYAEAFKQLGVSMPENREGLLDLLGSFDRTTESGARLYAQILTLGAGFLETEEAAQQLEDQRTESYRKLLSDEENLALDRKNLADEFAKLGYTLPKSKDQLRGWIDALTNSADVAGTEKERLQKIAEAYDNALGGSTGFEKFIDYAGQTEEEARNTANGLIALIEATLDYQGALDKSTEAARNAREEATRAYTATALDLRTAAIESLRSPEELAARDARQLAESSRGLTSSFEKLGFALPNSVEELRGFFEQIGGLPNWASTGPTAENALLDLVAPFIEYMALKDKVLGIDEATSSNDAIERARDNLRAAYDDQRVSLEKTRDAMRGFVDSLKQYRTSLLMGDKSPLNPLEKYRLAQSAFDTTSALAATGDEDALARLQSVSSEFLDASRAMYASGEAYSQDFSKVLDALDAAGIAATIEETLAQQSLDKLELQVGALIDINESVLSVEAAIRELVELTGGVSTGGVGNFVSDGYVRNAYQTVLGRSADDGGLAYWKQQLVSGAVAPESFNRALAEGALNFDISAYKGNVPVSTLDDSQKNALAWLKANAIPGYADGGMHAGGLRLVGERGMEIEATGPARYWNFNQTQQMLGSNPELVAEVRALRAEVAALRQQQANEHREAVAANYDANDRNATRIAEATERIDRQRRTAERFA